MYTPAEILRALAAETVKRIVTREMPATGLRFFQRVVHELEMAACKLDERSGIGKHTARSRRRKAPATRVFGTRRNNEHRAAQKNLSTWRRH